MWSVKELEMGRLSWTVCNCHSITKCNCKCPYKRAAGGDLTTEEKADDTTVETERFEDTLLLGLKMERGAISQGLQQPQLLEIEKYKERDSTTEPPKEWPCQCPGLC